MLVDYSSAKHACPSAFYATLTHVTAAWDDDNNLVSIEEFCSYCEQGPPSPKSGQPDIKAIKTTAGNIKKFVLPQYDGVLATIKNEKISIP